MDALDRKSPNVLYVGDVIDSFENVWDMEDWMRVSWADEGMRWRVTAVSPAINLENLEDENV